jgi:hypothetical protein
MRNPGYLVPVVEGVVLWRHRAVGLVLLVLTVLGYAGLCWFWPWVPCRRCTAGRRRAPVGRGTRICPTCGGVGWRKRLGRQFLETLTGRREAR